MQLQKKQGLHIKNSKSPSKKIYHDNAGQHTAKVTQQKLNVMESHTPSSPNIELSVQIPPKLSNGKKIQVS